MKRKVIGVAVWIVLMMLIPFLAMGAQNPSQTTSQGSALSSVNASEVSSDSASTASNENSAQDLEESFRIMDESTGEVITVSNEEFAYGSVAAEMPPTFEAEALKAQAVAAFTYYSHIRQQQRESPSSELHGADFSADLSKGEVYVSKTRMQELWGDQFDSYYTKLTQAVRPVMGQVLESDGELITAVFHAISGGNTETSADIFGGDEKSYLISVPSPGDLLAPNYQTTVEKTAEEFKNAILEKWPACSLDGEPQSWVGSVQRTSAGSVKTIQVGGVEISGTDLREVFSLRSANFDLLYSGDSFRFTVRGYGHGVGMSQYGANYMALQGSDYTQILSWYYPNTQLISP